MFFFGDCCCFVGLEYVFFVCLFVFFFVFLW